MIMIIKMIVIMKQIHLLLSILLRQKIDLNQLDYFHFKLNLSSIVEVLLILKLMHLIQNKKNITYQVYLNICYIKIVHQFYQMVKQLKLFYSYLTFIIRSE